MRFHNIFFSNRDALRVNDFVTNIRGNRLYSAGIALEFITISKIALDNDARKLKNQLRIS